MLIFPSFSYGEKKDMHERLVIGEVLKPQGIRGEIKVNPYLDDASDIKKFRTVYIDGKEYKVLSARAGGGFAYLALSGIADRNGAELLRGKELEGLRSEAPAPDEGRYFIVDLIGCAVVTESGKRLGEITEVIPAHTDIFVMKEGETEYMFPAAEGVVIDVDIEGGVLTVDAKRFNEVAIEQEKGERKR